MRVRDREIEFETSRCSLCLKKMIEPGLSPAGVVGFYRCRICRGGNPVPEQERRAVWEPRWGGGRGSDAPD